MSHSRPAIQEGFRFGENWSRFLRGLDEEAIGRAQSSLCAALGLDSLAGLRFLDVGTGSGLSSLVARRLGAHVHSFDVDPVCVRCAGELKRRYFPGDRAWTIEQGSVLDRQYLASIGEFDVVYSWGVLHHTGSLWLSLQNVIQPVRTGGSLYIAIYNDQGWLSRYWLFIKRLANANEVTRALVIAVHAPYLLGVRFMVRALRGELSLDRGMSLWHDMLDWLGGYPFEVASPAEIERFFAAQGFTATGSRLCGRRHGCNELTFRRGG